MTIHGSSLLQQYSSIEQLVSELSLSLSLSLSVCMYMCVWIHLYICMHNMYVLLPSLQYIDVHTYNNVMQVSSGTRSWFVFSSRHFQAV